MKRTRIFRQVKNANSVLPEKITSSKTDSSKEQQSTLTTLTKSKLSFENLSRNLLNGKKRKTKISKPTKLRATIDLEMMKEELKQLEDPPVTAEEKEICSKRLQYSFFNVPCTELAQKLLGKILVRRLENGTILKGRIVETEAYLGEIDKASQTYQAKVTPRNLPMYMPPGTIYVYLTYGMYHCFNISSAGKGCAILLRGLEPIDGINQMRSFRTAGSKSRKQSQQISKILSNHELCNGPSKLCMAFEIEKIHCKYSICNYKSLWIENDEIVEDAKIIKSSRIGIDTAGPEWANKCLRYYIYGNTSVSKRDKKAEAEFFSKLSNL